MTLNLSKVVFLTLLVIFISGCAENKPEVQPSKTTTQPVKPSATVPITPFPTAPPATETPIPTSTAEAAPSAAAIATATPLPPNVAVIPDPEDYIWEVIADGFSRPTGLAAPQDSSARLFVLEQEGLIRVLQGGMRSPCHSWI